MQRARDPYGLRDAIGIRVGVLDTSALLLPGRERCGENSKKNERFTADLARVVTTRERIVETPLLISEAETMAEKYGEEGHEDVYRGILRVIKALKTRGTALPDELNVKMLGIFDSEDICRYDLSVLDRYIVSLATATAELGDMEVSVLSNDRDLLDAGVHVSASRKARVHYYSMIRNYQGRYNERFNRWMHRGSECKACWERFLDFEAPESGYMQTSDA